MFNKSRFQIHNIDYSGADSRFVVGCVTFLSNEQTGGADLMQAVTAKVRIKSDLSMSMEDLHEALFQKSVEQLQQTLNRVKNKTAKDLQAETSS